MLMDTWILVTRTPYYIVVTTLRKRNARQRKCIWQLIKNKKITLAEAISMYFYFNNIYSTHFALHISAWACFCVSSVLVWWDTSADIEQNSGEHATTWIAEKCHDCLWCCSLHQRYGSRCRQYVSAVSSGPTVARQRQPRAMTPNLDRRLTTHVFRDANALQSGTSCTTANV